MIPLSRAAGLLSAAAGLLLAGPAGAQRVQKDAAPMRPDTACFAVTLGPDTLAKERVIRGEGRLDGDLRLLRPQAMVVQYTVFLRRDGTADSLRSTQVSGAAAAQASILFRGDSAVLTMHAPGLVEPLVDRIALTPGALPFINLSAGILDQIFRRARIAGGNDVVIPLLAGPRELPGRVRFIGRDSAVLDLGVELRAAVGADGALHGAVVPAQGVRFARTIPDAEVPGGPPPADTGRGRGEAGPVLPRELSALLRASADPDVASHPVPGVNHLFREDASGHWRAAPRSRHGPFRR